MGVHGVCAAVREAKVCRDRQELGGLGAWRPQPGSGFDCTTVGAQQV